MKKLLTVISVVCMSVFGLSSTAFAGIPGPGECGWSGEMCAGDVEFEVDVVCFGLVPIVTGSVVLGNDGDPTFDFAFFDDSGAVCEMDGYLDMLKTEVKCTAVGTGPGHKSKNGSSTGKTVEVEMKATGSDACL